MRPGLLFAVTLVSACLLDAPALALPDLERPAYSYQIPLPTDFTSRHNDGAPTSAPAAPDDYYLFEARKPGVTGEQHAPVIVYIHGAAPWPSAPHPTNIRPQIEHYVQSGYTVVWLMFCDGTPWLRPCIDFDVQEETALASLASAFEELRDPGHVHPSVDAQGRPQVVFVAHSVGTVMAARMAAQLGREQQDDVSVPAPAALILHDPAGYEQKWDVGDLHVDIRATFPLEWPALEGLRADTKLLLLVAEGSEPHSNSLSTAPRLLAEAHLPAEQEQAWVVPHQQVKATNCEWSWGRWRWENCDLDYPSPTGAIEGRTRDVHGTFEHIYYSVHETPGIGTPVSRRGFDDHTLSCAAEALSGAERCSDVTYMGRWMEDGVPVHGTREKYRYQPSAP
jgi:pimeloyl-ACP methyl ester carboxylesterase